MSWKNFITGAAIGAYALSFLFPACGWDPPLSSDRDVPMLGFEAFIGGLPICCFFSSPFVFFAWLANPAFWRGLYLLRVGSRLQAFWWASAALILASAGLAAIGLTVVELNYLDVGAYLWMASFSVLAVGSLLTRTEVSRSTIVP